MELTRQQLLDFLNESSFLNDIGATYSVAEYQEDAELVGAIEKDGMMYVILLDNDEDIQHLSMAVEEIFPGVDEEMLKMAGDEASNKLWAGFGGRIMTTENSAHFCISFPTQMTGDLDFTLRYSMMNIDLAIKVLDESLSALEQELGDEPDDEPEEIEEKVFPGRGRAAMLS